MIVVELFLLGLTALLVGLNDSHWNLPAAIVAIVCVCLCLRNGARNRKPRA